MNNPRYVVFFLAIAAMVYIWDTPDSRISRLPDGHYTIKASDLGFAGTRTLGYAPTGVEYVFVNFVVHGDYFDRLAPKKILLSEVPGDPEIEVYHDGSGPHFDLIVPKTVAWASEVPTHQRMGGR